jgi:hypothetical protein
MMMVSPPNQKLALFFLLCFHYLQFFNARAHKISKVCIVGGGLAGLSLTLSLLKSPSNNIKEIIICESRPEFDQSKLGGGIQLSGGAQVLKELGLEKELTKFSLPVQQIKCYNRKNERLYSLDINQLFSKEKRKTGKSLQARTIMRNTLHQILLQSIHQHIQSDSSPIQVKFLANHRIQEIVSPPPLSPLSSSPSSSSTAQIYFQSGTIEENIDLIIGCDGINSQIRQYLSIPQSSSSSSAAAAAINPVSTASYLGIRITYCITKPFLSSSTTTALSNEQHEIHQYMGDGIYVLIASYGSQQLEDEKDNSSHHQQTMMAIVYRSPEDAPLADNGQWKTTIEKKILLQQLQQRLQTGQLANIEEIQQVFQTLENDIEDSEEMFFDVGVRDRWLSSIFQPWYSSYSSMQSRDVSLPVAGREGVPIVLIGDSAHPM